MVPKRHAKRSVTRSLVKRQMRAAMDTAMASAVGLSGTWLVRLRQPIDVKRFPSAASQALRAMLHAELDGVVAQIVRNTGAVAAAGVRT
jgi:ribonuclease P protein component